MRNIDTMSDRLNELAEVSKRNAVSETEARDAFAILERDYFNDVRAIVADAIRAIRDGEVADEDAVSDWLWERLDGHGRIIYTHRARIALLCSNNPDAYENENGEAGASDEVRAFYAMRADVIDCLSAESEDHTLGWFFDEADEDD